MWRASIGMVMVVAVTLSLGRAEAGRLGRLVGHAAPAVVAMAQTQPATGDFVPVSELPASEHLPAAPLLVGAYIVVWLVVLVYLLSLWRRMVAVDREIAELERRIGEQRRT